MVEAGININDVARHFGSHKTAVYLTINRFWQTGLAGDRPKSADRKNPKSTEGTFHSYHINATEISFSKLALLTSRNCL